MRDRTDIARGIAQAEGLLLCEAEKNAARAAATAFADRMPWLTAPQREEVVRLHAADRLEVSRHYLHRVADRCHELRREYTDRYQRLRRRLVCCWVLAGLAGLALYGCLLAWRRPC